MDFLQLVFGFVNAPLFATFLLGMFWKRTTGHGAFTGLLAGTGAAAVTHGLTHGRRQGRLDRALHTFPSTMAQNFWIAIFAWTTCLVVTILVSFVTKPKTESEFITWSTASPTCRWSAIPWHHRPKVLAVIVAAILDSSEHDLLVTTMNDLRVPTGLLFSLLGILLLIYSAVRPDARAPLTETNLNLWCGLVAARFWRILLWLSRRTR